MNEKGKNNESYNAAMIEKYLQGKLSPDEMHAIEKAALDDPFLADAIEGLSLSLQSGGRNAMANDMADLRQRLNQRVANDKNKIIPIFSIRYWWQVAAVVFVLALSGTFTYYIIRGNETEKKSIAQTKEKAIESKIDSVPTAVPGAASPKSDTEVLAPGNPKISEPSRSAEVRKKNTGLKTIDKDEHISDSGAVASVEDQSSYKRKEPASVPEKETPLKAAAIARSDDFEQPPKQNSFIGKVTDQHNKPIAAASVELKDKKIAAITDNNGNFKLNIKDTDSTVVAKVNSAGYEPAVIDLSKNSSPNIIILREDKNNLQEVVTTGSSKRRKTDMRQQTAQDAAPLIGWVEYNKYLERNKKAPQDSVGLRGPVVVSFIVNQKGTLSRFAIEQSLGPGYDEEAIRLIKDGPAWKLLKGKKANITVTVTY